jgi:hypothetical protein
MEIHEWLTHTTGTVAATGGSFRSLTLLLRNIDPNLAITTSITLSFYAELDDQTAAFANVDKVIFSDNRPDQIINEPSFSPPTKPSNVKAILYSVTASNAQANATINFLGLG